MAEYGRIGQASDYMREEASRGGRIDPDKTSILKVNVTTTTVVDLGGGPYTVEHIRELARQLEDLPPNKKVSIQYYDSQRDGQSFKVTV